MNERMTVWTTTRTDGTTVEWCRRNGQHRSTQAPAGLNAEQRTEWAHRCCANLERLGFRYIGAKEAREETA